MPKQPCQDVTYFSFPKFVSNQERARTQVIPTPSRNATRSYADSRVYCRPSQTLKQDAWTPPLADNKENQSILTPKHALVPPHSNTPTTPRRALKRILTAHSRTAAASKKSDSKNVLDYCSGCED